MPLYEPPDRLKSANSQLILSDDAINQTLTNDLGSILWTDSGGLTNFRFHPNLGLNDTSIIYWSTAADLDQGSSVGELGTTGSALFGKFGGSTCYLSTATNFDVSTNLRSLSGGDFGSTSLVWNNCYLTNVLSRGNQFNIYTASPNVQRLSIDTAAIAAFNIRNSAITLFAQADSVPLTLSGYSVTGSGTSGMLALSGTLNTSGSPTVFLQNITNTASGATTKLFDWQVGGATRFNLDPNGLLISTLFNTTYTTTQSLISLNHSCTLSGATSKTISLIKSAGSIALGTSTNSNFIGWQVVSNMTGSASNTNSYKGFSFSSTVSGTACGNVHVFSSTMQASASCSEFTSFRSSTTQVTGGATGTARVTGFEDNPGDGVQDINWSTYGAAFVSRTGTWDAGNGVSVMPDWYGLRVEDQTLAGFGTFATTPRKHGFSIAMESNFFDNIYLYWGPSHTTALASRTAGLRWNTTNSAFEIEAGTTARIAIKAADVGVKAGASTGIIAKVGGSIFDHFADVTVGGAEADIYTDTLPANILSVNGEKVIASYGGNFVTVGTEITQLKAKFAGTTIWDSTGVAPTTGTTSWRIYIEITRVSATVIRFTVSLNTSGASGFVYATVGELTGLTLSGTNILKITGTSSGVGSGSGDIVGKMSYVRWEAAA